MKTALAVLSVLIGTSAREWTFSDWHNSPPLTLSRLRGRVVVVRFWTTGCPFCEKSMPALQQLARELRDQPVTFIGAFHDKPQGSAPDMKEAIKVASAWNIAFPLAFDRGWRTLRAWYLDGHDRPATSATFVIGKDGRIAHVDPGPVADIPSLRAAILRANSLAPLNACYDLLRAMIRTALLPALLVLPTLAAAKPWKPHPIKVIQGVPLKPEDIKPYFPPKLLPEPPLEPTDVKVVQVSTAEAVIQMRPWSSPMVGNAIHGARLPVKGVVKTTRGGCSSKVWYALEPFGYLCGKEGNPTDQPATTEQVLKVKEGSRLPFQYVMALIKEGDKIPMWTTLDDLKNGAQPERQLERGDTVAVEKTYTHDGQKYWITVDAEVTPQKGYGMMGPGASWHGLDLDESVALPFGWVTPDKTPAYATPPQKGEKATPVMQIERRTRLTILEEQLVAKKKWLKVTVAAPPPPPTFGEIMSDAAKKAAAAQAAQPAAPLAPGDGGVAAAPPPPSELWVSADALNEVRKLAIPKTIQPGVAKWIDVDLGEQVLVAYEGEKPVYATLVSSGRAIPTPMGTYPVWAKVSAITMKNQPYEDKGYYVNKVPWSTFFQWHNAIHGAYWHDRFGVTKSHGCVNVAPLDARHVFEWVTPALPPGWTGLRPLDLLQSPHVVVRNSHMKKEFRQDRPIGPPDRGLEAERLEEAEKRRTEEAQAAAATAAQPGAPGVPAQPGAPTQPGAQPQPVVQPPPTPSVVPPPTAAQPAPKP